MSEQALRSAQLVLALVTLPFCVGGLAAINAGRYGLFILALVSGVAIFLAASALLGKRVHKLEMDDQRKRDDLASCVLQKIQSGETTYFTLFLRPFYIKDQIEFGVNHFGGRYRIYSFERQIVSALEKSHSVIALGQPGETVGVARTEISESDWRHLASTLINKASLVICVPSMRPGTKWEIDYIIANDLLHKVVFIMPPDYWAHKFKAMRLDWEIISGYIQKFGIKFPFYHYCGLLFRFNPDGECIKEDLELQSPWLLGRGIARLRTYALLDTAAIGFRRIADTLKLEISRTASAATVEPGPEGGWCIRLNEAELEVVSPRMTSRSPWGSWQPPAFKVFAHAAVGLRIPPDRHGFEGRGHSLWFCDASDADIFHWFETAFVVSPLIGKRGRRNPFALNPGEEAARALSTSGSEFEVAWPFTSLDVGGLQEFIDRWASWFADAAQGRLQHPGSVPERPVEGSWRRK